MIYTCVYKSEPFGVLAFTSRGNLREVSDFDWSALGRIRVTISTKGFFFGAREGYINTRALRPRQISARVNSARSKLEVFLRS